MSSLNADQIRFADLDLPPQLLKSLEDLGYETPTAIQAQTIPPLLAGKDLVGQAQTGTGKTAAFALPLLSRLDLKQTEPSVLVLTPTRELAIQVAKAFQGYASHLKGFHVLPVYGGANMSDQIRQLRRGVHVVVGTPGRLMDHIRRGTLKLDKLQALILDEADEMLRMGFIDDVEWILEHTPPTRQTALFSATMPQPIRRIARKHLKNPEEITIQLKTNTAETINQRYCLASGMTKLDVLARILATEDIDGVLIFVRTKHSTGQIAEKLIARGYACAALNGDIAQRTREKTVEQLKNGQLDIVVATDVAARGLDVKRISHVINFDIPHDTEAYIHRIGRTGRAGCKGEAILFIAHHERHLLTSIERSTRQKITLMKLPSQEAVSQKRQRQLKEQIQKIIEQDNFQTQSRALEQYQQDWEWDLPQIAAALLKLVQDQNPAFQPHPIELDEYKETFKRKDNFRKKFIGSTKWRKDDRTSFASRP